MRIVEPVGHRAAVEGLWRAARSDRLPHALSFEGPAGIGKFAAAVWFAAGLLCAEGPGAPCGACRSCKQLASGDWRGGHPDVLRIDPVEEGWDETPIAAIAERSGDKGGEQSLAAFLSLRPLEGDRRVVLLREAERLNEHAQNALLKTLEEPAPGTLLVLECSRTGRLLPTVRSRTVSLLLTAPPRDVALRVLAEAGVAPLQAEALAVLAEDSPGAALALLKQGAPAVLELVEALLAGERAPLDAAAALWELDGDFGEGTVLQQGRRRARLALDLAIARVAAARRAAAGALAGEAEVARDPAGRTEVALAALLERLLERRRDVDANLDPGAVVELAALDLAPRRAPARR